MARQKQAEHVSSHLATQFIISTRDAAYLRLPLIIVTGSGHLIYSTDVFGTLQHTETLAFVGAKVVLKEWTMIISEFDLVVGHAARAVSCSLSSCVDTVKSAGDKFPRAGRSRRLRCVLY
jgi:hypothetical protein